MNVRPPKSAPLRLFAVAVLLLLLAATFLILWQRSVARELQAARWREGFIRVNVVLLPLLNCQSLQDCAKATLLADDVSASDWEKFLSAAEWRQRYAGLQAVGYLDPVPETNGEPSLRLKFFSCREDATNAPPFDPTTEPVISAALNNWYRHSNGLAAVELTLPLAGPQTLSSVSFFPLKKKYATGAQISQLRPDPSDVLFFQLNQAEFFKACQPQLAGQTIELKLLAPGEPESPRTLTQRVFSTRTMLGEWRFLATLRLVPSGINFPPWLLLAGGLVLGGIFFWLFARQTRLRYQAETSRELVLAREAEILALNRDLEQKISARTAELNVALAEEKELNRLKTNFTSMVTHEIRTPLEIILSSADILLRYLDRLQPERRTAHLLGIKSAVARMNALMSDVLLFSRAEAGRMEFNPAALELGALCKRIVDEILSATNRRCAIRLAVHGADEPARADENLLRHILTNLLSNAIKYSPAGSEVALSVFREGGSAVFVVQDSGTGITDEDRRRIFTPFFRGNNVAAIEGTGLGLVIVKHCVEQHGGTIEMASPTEGGTKATVRLPLFSPAHTDFLRKISTDGAE